MGSLPEVAEREGAQLVRLLLKCCSEKQKNGSSRQLVIRSK